MDERQQVKRQRPTATKAKKLWPSKRIRLAINFQFEDFNLMDNDDDDFDATNSVESLTERKRESIVDNEPKIQSCFVYIGANVNQKYN